QGHGLHRLVVEHLALVVLHGEDDVRVGYQPLVVARPLRAAADRLVEVVDPAHVDLGMHRVLHEHEADGQVHGIPFREGLPNALDVERRPILDAGIGLDPDGERPVRTVRPPRQRGVAEPKDLADVRALLRAAKPAAYCRTLALVVTQLRKEQRTTHTAGGALFARRGNRVDGADLRSSGFLDSAKRAQPECCGKDGEGGSFGSLHTGRLTRMEDSEGSPRRRRTNPARPGCGRPEVGETTSCARVGHAALTALNGGGKRTFLTGKDERRPKKGTWPGSPIRMFPLGQLPGPTAVRPESRAAMGALHRGTRPDATNRSLAGVKEGASGN